MRIGAVIVLYYPQVAAVESLLQTLANKVDVLSIVDNSPSKTALTLPACDVHFHHFSDNKGIATAQNLGLNDLIVAGCDYAMLLDQDSTVSPSLVPELISKLVNSDDERLIAVGPRIVCSFSEKAVKPKVQRELRSQNGLSFVTQIISSGMMISINKLADVGLKEDGLFIDGVDHEWCWRARAQSYQIAIADDIKMVHTMGEKTSNLLGIEYRVGSPIRLYYQFRNILVLSRREYVPFYWKCRNIGIMPMRFITNALLQPNRRARAKYMMLGLVDGLRNRRGAFTRWH